MTRIPEPHPGEGQASEEAAAQIAGIAAGDVAAGPHPALPSTGRSAQLVAAGIFLSRIAGFVRLHFTARFFGTGIAADAFSAALKIPNFLQNLLGEGVLSASFIPAYSELIKHGRKQDAGRLAGAIFALLLAVAGAFTLLGVLAAPLMVDLLTTGFTGQRRELTIAATRIIFPMTGVLVLSAWALGVLNSHRRFFVSYVAPVVWNAAIIAVLIVFGTGMTPGRLVIAASWGALLGGALQFLIQLPFVLNLEPNVRVRWDTRMPEVREAVRHAGPAIMGRGVVQVSAYLDLWLAGFLTVGSVAAMTYALTLYVLPVSLFGMSVAAAELPELARERAGDPGVLRERVNAGLRQIYFFVVPSFVFFMLLGDVIVGGLLRSGDFGHIETMQVYLTLAAFSIGLLASTGTRLFSSTFFALHDTRTPARTATLRVVLSGVLGAALMFPFDRIALAPEKTLGAVGLGLGAGFAAWLEWWTLQRTLSRSLGPIRAGWGPLGRMFAAALAAAILGRTLDYLLPDFVPLLRAAVILSPAGLLYLGIAHALGLPQARSVTRRLLRRRA